ncbi:RlpA-like double-psi beta-barrel-protein domain-containing protein-containing protein, partial [Schizothecium vesticola]
GNLTYFSPALGACGWTSSDTDAVCAIPHDIFDGAAPRVSSGGNPDRNPLCGRLIRVTSFLAAAGNTKRQVSVDVMVADRCVDCEANDLDLSLGAFKQIAPEGSGAVSGKWQWL